MGLFRLYGHDILSGNNNTLLRIAKAGLQNIGSLSTVCQKVLSMSHRAHDIQLLAPGNNNSVIEMYVGWHSALCSSLFGFNSCDVGHENNGANESKADFTGDTLAMIAWFVFLGGMGVLVEPMERRYKKLLDDSSIKKHNPNTIDRDCLIAGLFFKRVSDNARELLSSFEEDITETSVRGLIH